MGSSKPPYDERTDIEKIRSQWNKLIGLHERKEWSASIMRAATAAEIAANFVIRKEFEKHSRFNAAFVDSLLLWANGLRGKMEKLVLKFPAAETRKAELKKLAKLSTEINEVRNQVAHSGNFANSSEARLVESKARIFIEGMVSPYERGFSLKRLKIDQTQEHEQS
ncbi:hypothetical protein [Agrobacterium tumefaciens]|uniref:hypothetical protein n=1 Tax=Agrobacterium TaxID=357 RepID=UPI0015736CC5|nr:hypothetical protein [Agrobacterium tumefaciens]NTE34669.1 hypothetical protein [Agrobacterium tumefaciens]NTE50179.1 hypothetical protein [Agrobacterium tumefaciens]